MTTATAATDTKPKKPATVVTAVNMLDGSGKPTERVVEFPGKRKLQKESFIAEDGTITTVMDFVNGQSRTFVLKPGAKLFPKFAAHGIEQKLGDETAGEDDLDDAIEAVDQLIGRLNKDEWTMERAGGGMSGTSILLKALVEATSKPIETVRAFLQGKTQAEKMALRQSTNLKPIVDRLESEKAKKAAPVDTGALFAELAGIGAAPAQAAAPAAEKPKAAPAKK